MAATTTVLIAPPPLGTPFLDERGRVTAPWQKWLITITSTGSVVEDLTSTVAGALIAANNLADVLDKAAARLNLGLGTAAVHASTDFDVSGAAAAAQAAAVAASDPAGSAAAAQAAAIAASDPLGAAAAVLASSLQKSANLSDLANAGTARTNLGLGTAAQQNTTAFDAAGAAAAAVAAIPNADATHTGTLTAADWSSFNGKQAALTLPLSIAQGGTGQITASAALTALGAASLVANTFTGNQVYNFGSSGKLQTISTNSLAIQLWKDATPTKAAAVGLNTNDFAISTFDGTSWSTARVTVVNATGNVLIGTTSDNATDKLQVNGSLTAAGVKSSGSVVAPIVSKSAAYTATTSDFSVLADATSAAFSVTLPASPLTGQIVNVKKIDSSGNAVTIAGNGKNIDGAASKSLAAQWATAQLQYNGTAWFTL